MNSELSRTRGARLRLHLAAAVITAIALVGGGAYGADRAAASAAPAAKIVSGWPGGLKSYQGRYKLVSSSSAGFAKSGDLTIFGRIVPGIKGLQMSGILALYASAGSFVVYVTHFEQIGTKMSATVNSGLFTGPIIGTFQLVTHKGAAVAASFVPSHGTPVSLHFKLVSSNPHP